MKLKQVSFFDVFWVVWFFELTFENSLIYWLQASILFITCPLWVIIRNYMSTRILSKISLILILLASVSCNKQYTCTTYINNNGIETTEITTVGSKEEAIQFEETNTKYWEYTKPDGSVVFIETISECKK